MTWQLAVLVTLLTVGSWLWAQTLAHELDVRPTPQGWVALLGVAYCTVMYMAYLFATVWLYIGLLRLGGSGGS